MALLIPAKRQIKKSHYDNAPLPHLARARSVAALTKGARRAEAAFAKAMARDQTFNRKSDHAPQHC
jgi:hypothetical protein